MRKINKLLKRYSAHSAISSTNYSNLELWSRFLYGLIIGRSCSLAAKFVTKIARGPSPGPSTFFLIFVTWRRKNYSRAPQQRGFALVLQNSSP